MTIQYVSSQTSPFRLAGHTRFAGVALILALLFALTGIPAFANSIIFSDNFSGPTLNPAWVQLPGTGSVTVGNGDLQYNNQGPIASPSGWNNTSFSLLLPFSGNDWEADLEATYNLAWCLPGNNVNGPAVPNQSCSAGAQTARIGVVFDPVTATTRGPLGGNDFADFYRGTDAWYGSDILGAEYGGNQVTNLLAASDSGIHNNFVGGTYFYRIVRNGGTITMNYSSDGVHYATALTATLADPADLYNALVISATTFWNAGSGTGYGPITIQSLASPTPEPSSLFLIGGGLMLVPLLGNKLRQTRATRDRSCTETKRATRT